MTRINEIPKHVAIIPDGNRRWAKEHNLDPWIGHEEGAKVIEDITRKSRELGIKYISFWGSSVENMQKRPVKERRALIDIYEKYFNKLISSKEIFEDEVQINVFGNWREGLPKKIVKIIENGIEKTKKHNKFYLNFFLLYSGDDEMLKGIQHIIESGVSSSKITTKTIKESLFTKNLPVVDYLVRTGGEPHLSAGFMMWDIANAQLFFSEKYFPEFGAGEFTEAIDEYIGRVRRLGA